MAIEKTKAAEASDISVEEKLRTLYQLQVVNSEVDKIRTLRGELPLEVQDLEDEIVGLETRINKFKEEVKSLEQSLFQKERDQSGGDNDNQV